MPGSADLHPYKQFPPRQFWQSTVASRPWAEVLADERGKFTIGPGQAVASAGSCFAQRISRLIVDAGLDYRYFEAAHPLLTPASALEHGYGLYSCRYGNIYTPRQLLQLAREALGRRPPIDAYAQRLDGRWVDLMRPQIDQAGFESRDEAVADRAHHLRCVATMLARCDVFIYTLGLTETWFDAAADVVYGSHPAVTTQRPHPTPLVPRHLDYIECYNDLVEFFNLVGSVNARVRYILTVSPVALAATHRDRHVLVASSESKAVLRAVAGRFAELMPQVDYFPAFEIFNLAPSFGQFLSADLRDVSPRGVQVAMANFRRMFIDAPAAAVAAASAASTPVAAPPRAAPAATVQPGAEVECDEILNAFFAAAPISA